MVEQGIEESIEWYINSIRNRIKNVHGSLYSVFNGDENMYGYSKEMLKYLIGSLDDMEKTFDKYKKMTDEERMEDREYTKRIRGIYRNTKDEL